MAATTEHLEARPGCRTSIDSYRNPLGLDSRLLGNLDLEHAIGIARLDRLSSCRIRQGETAQKSAGGAFNVFEAVAANALPRRHLDRKSTRLNSSHSQISYPVFCL